MAKTILGIVGSYRKNGIIDRLVTEALLSAEASGAVTKKIYLTDAQIEFCTNCRHCMQEPGPERGKCIHDDDMEAILKEWEKCDGLIIGSPVNFYNVTAVTRKFMERLIGFAYWPWGQPSPVMRSKKKDKAAVLITATAMPAIMGHFFTGAPRALKLTVETMGAKPIKTIFAGLAAQQEKSPPSEKAIRQAQAAGRHLAG
ncbi:MAG: flavodoxin family protein [bacterium]|jgi:multimeric flavodoxin WrbA